MKRTTLYLEPELEVLLKIEMQRQKRPMAEIVREAVRAYVTREPREGPPGAGAFSSGRRDTAEKAEEVLAETGFGDSAPSAGRVRARRARAQTRRRSRR
ncbi:MAG TPA: CopG family transcriptional regulator [Vicinamibacterales bacterium]|nr:CopG family transcriptional regulator [Vicinamibacterales bacterium]